MVTILHVDDDTIPVPDKFKIVFRCGGTVIVNEEKYEVWQIVENDTHRHIYLDKIEGVE